MIPGLPMLGAGSGAGAGSSCQQATAMTNSESDQSPHLRCGCWGWFRCSCILHSLQWSGADIQKESKSKKSTNRSCCLPHLFWLCHRLGHCCRRRRRGAGPRTRGTVEGVEDGHIQGGVLWKNGSQNSGRCPKSEFLKSGQNG